MPPPPLPPKGPTSAAHQSTGRTPLLGSGHLRQRSQSAINGEGGEFEGMIGRDGKYNSDVDTVVNFDTEYVQDDREDLKSLKARGEGHDDVGTPLLPSGAANPGYIVWQDKKMDQTRKKNARCLLIMLMVTSAFGGWIVGIVAPPQNVESFHRLGESVEKVLDRITNSSSTCCNPYDLHGVLNVSLTVASENVWEPLAAPESCQPVDYMSLLQAAVASKTTPKELEFTVNRTIVIYGDSVDRDHNEHFCYLVGGYHEMIGVENPLSPPYPPGDEIPPEGYKNFVTGDRVWPDYAQSRPFVCHVGHLGLRILNVFHYGFRSRTKMIENHPHFYPPATVEERFDQIVVPIVDKLATTYGVDAVPTLISITPGYWGLLRQAVEDDKNLVEAMSKGDTVEQAQAKFDTWRTMSPQQREWNQHRTADVLRHIARGWITAKQQPAILWRALHHTKEQHNLPYNRIQALDQIGRSVVSQLVAEGQAAEAGDQGWTKWVAKFKTTFGASVFNQTSITSPDERSEAAMLGLGHRLKIDEWGFLMRGQEKHFRDNVHPLPLPGSYLYGNMLMTQLRMVVDGC